VIFAEFFTNTKNGMAILLVPLFLFLANFILSYPWNFKKIIIALIIAIPISLATGYIAKKHIEANAAWPMLFEDIRIGIDIDNFQSWKNPELYPYPKNSQGIPVNVSTYERSAWATSALRLIKENPLGYGLVHHSFGALALDKMPDFRRPIERFRGASHSGLIDFTLGVGIPGLLLVLIPFGVAFYRAFNQAYFWMQFVRWIFPVILIAYLITEASNNHFIEFLFFIVAFCIGLTLRPFKTEHSYSK
jgi:O-antigen ligase